MKLLGRVKGHLRRSFFAGILVTIPVGITAFLSIFFFRFFDRSFGPRITSWLVGIGVPLEPGAHIPPGLGLVVAVMLVMAVGLLVNNYVGRKVVARGEDLLSRIPYIRAIYSGAKQILETVANADANAFKKVVMIEFPRAGTHTVGFLASSAADEVAQRLGEADLVNVFVPTVPNVTTGFLIVVPRRDIVELEMTVEEGFKMVISGGILTPPKRESSRSVEAVRDVLRDAG